MDLVEDVGVVVQLRDQAELVQVFVVQGDALEID